VIERIGGVVELAGSSVSPPRPRRVKQPIARAQPKEFTYRDTELIEHFVDFTVILGSGARQTILDEIKGVQRDIGEVEAGGRLIAQQRPKAASKSRVTLLLDAVLPGNGPVAYCPRGSPAPQHAQRRGIVPLDRVGRTYDVRQGSVPPQAVG
jgi:hypothetical protein